MCRTVVSFVIRVTFLHVLFFMLLEKIPGSIMNYSLRVCPYVQDSIWNLWAYTSIRPAYVSRPQLYCLWWNLDMVQLICRVQNSRGYLQGHRATLMQIHFRATTLLFMVGFKYGMTQINHPLIVIFQGASIGSTDILVSVI